MSQIGLFSPPSRPAASRRGFDLPDAEIWLDPDWLPPDRASVLFDRLMDEVPWRQDQITMYGKTHHVPRLNAWYGDPGTVYTWSGIRMEPHPWEGGVGEIKARLEAEVGLRFNSALLNLYRDGQDSVAWHADDEPELGPDPVIASVSLGATRTFRLRHLDGAHDPVNIDLDHGSLLFMGGRTQRCWHHCVPRRKRVDGPRINLTFRQMVG
ncbi:MAG: alpha-ketoglutarate-dependent dioxygenase AlkB [Deltaproteobacteria bacterium]|nr:MAG: alpha-ketoglutarate-dependent dioxygenase AlkB [Deltaproteobacteria bacterium]